MGDITNLLEKRLQGGTPQEVAAELDLSLDEYIAIMKGPIDAFMSNRAHLVQEQLMVEHMRLERLVENAWENAENSDPKSVDIVLKVHDRMVKLCSLNINDEDSGVVGDINITRKYVSIGETKNA